MRLILNTAYLAVSSFILLSCNNNGNNSMNSNADSTKTDTINVARIDSSHTMTDTLRALKDSATATVSTPEQDFINVAVPGNLKEIAWLKIGEANGNKAIISEAAMRLKTIKK